MIGPKKLFQELKNKEIKKSDEQLLLFKIVNEYEENRNLLYFLLTGEKNEENIELGMEVQPHTNRKKEGNTYLDLALGNIRQRTNTESGIELGINKKEDFVFCEAKWKSDISYGVSKCTIRNQLQRVIETALIFPKKEFKGNIYVVLITPELYRNNYFAGINTRLYAYKYDEYRKNIRKTFIEELNLIESLNKIPFTDEKKCKDIIEKNLDKLILKWVTFEELIAQIPNDKNRIEINKAYEEYNS